MSSTHLVVHCGKCFRSVLIQNQNRKVWLKNEGWTGAYNGATSSTCPKCKRDKPVKDYWVKRDIDEATTSFICPPKTDQNYFYNRIARRVRVG